MSEASEFQELLQRAAAGDDGAMSELARRYEPEVRIVARARLSARMRPYLDSVDITQSVHRSLMAGLRAEKFDIASPEKLIGLAVTIVRRKIARHWRKLRRQKRDVSLSHQQNDAASVSTSVAAVDQYDYLIQGLGETDRKLIELRLAGHSTADAARKMGLDPDVVRVRLSRLRGQLRERLQKTTARHDS